MGLFGMPSDLSKDLSFMNSRTQVAFLALIVTQAAHSIEEYIFRLYDVFAPARFFSSLVSDNLTIGFAVVNFGFVLFGVWCYFARVRPGHASAIGLIWLWIVIEMINGIGHPAIALARGMYFPGVITAPVLLLIAIYLAKQMITFQHREKGEAIPSA